MGNIIKRFVIYYIFALFAIGWFIFVIHFGLTRNMIGDILSLTAGLLFLWFIAKSLIKSFNLNDKENQSEMNTRQKVLLTIAICEAFGLTTLTLLFFGSGPGHSKDSNPLVLLICAIPCAFTIRIIGELELFHVAPKVLAFLIVFFTQFVVYAILGLIISIVVCRKPEKY